MLGYDCSTELMALLFNFCCTSRLFFGRGIFDTAQKPSRYLTILLPAYALILRLEIMTIIVKTKPVENTFPEKNFFYLKIKRLTIKGKSDETNLFYLRPCITLPTNVTTENTSDLKKSETWWKYTPHH